MREVIYESYEVVAVTVRMTKEASERRDKLLDDGCCLGCEKKLTDADTVRCGQCDSCYQGMLRSIRAKKTTRQQEIREGFAIPAGKGGRPPQNPYTKKLARA